jgi:NAD-dependent SIR2 family protein deacetylase
VKKLVILTGAGISQESGIKTFRDADGLWNNYRIEEVASPAAWERDPQIDWFGETVPNIMTATSIVRNADIFLVIGTSLQVYPAAGLLQYVQGKIPKYLIDPEAEPRYFVQNLTIIREKASVGIRKLIELLKA